MDQFSYEQYQNSFLVKKLEAWGGVVLGSQLCSCHWWCHHIAEGLLCCHLLWPWVREWSPVSTDWICC